MNRASKILRGIVHQQHFHRPPLGALPEEGGCTFAVFSQQASRIWLCLFDDAEKEIDRLPLSQRADGHWFEQVPGIRAGQRYAYRVEGLPDPLPGACFNPNKLLIDPYARCLTRTLEWHDDLLWMGEQADHDSAHCVPKSVVRAPLPAVPMEERPAVSALNRVIYELHVKGFTQQHPGVPARLRGKYLGLCEPGVLDYLRSLHITTIQLMPCMSFMSEPRLLDLGLVNFWGYNPVNFFAPDWRYAVEDPVTEFREMVRGLHQAGFEVVMDVVYNHTAEAGLEGGMFSLKGFDSLHYYRLTPDRKAFLNYSGCGNSVRSEYPATLQMIMDSLRYWYSELGVDGFRFDLAASLGREELTHGAVQFKAHAGLLMAIAQDPVLRHALLIAEPWDVGDHGYQLGAFASPWLEVNDRFRDGVRAFWRGDRVGVAEFATRLMGSRDIFSRRDRPMIASVNHVTYHDGFTLEDLVSYRRRHNDANGEKGQDGHAHNVSTNHGEEGASTDPAVLAMRLQHKRNLIGTLLLARGTPHLLAGDERSRTQQGNNNAYCQDNPISWVDWSPLNDYQQAFHDFMVEALRLRTVFGSINHLSLTDETYYAVREQHQIAWMDTLGRPMSAQAWNDPELQFVALALNPTGDTAESGHRWLVLVNGAGEEVHFRLPEEWLALAWTCVLNSTGMCQVGVMDAAGIRVPPLTMALWHADPLAGAT